MIDLIAELNIASNVLNATLEKYLEACSSIYLCSMQTSALVGTPRELSDRVAHEFLSVLSFETNIKQAKSFIGQARNCSPALSPIHSLPSEILTRIFLLVIGARPCGITDNSGNVTSLPKYPDFLSHVCSRWRQILMELPSLWSHIDILHDHSLSQGFVARAEAYTARAESIPLEIHLRVPASQVLSNDGTLLDFLASAAPQLGSLELAIPGNVDKFDASRDILERCFQNCVPGMFTQLIIQDSGYYAPGFVQAVADMNDMNAGQVGLRLSQQHFEDVLRHMTVLRLDGIYPAWGSLAYHGLVELRLTCLCTTQVVITKLELAMILAQSPRLRLLEFGLEITDPLPGSMVTDNIPPAHFECLEVLSLALLEYDQIKILLGLLAPVATPLQLAIQGYDDTPQIVDNDEVTQFFTRSNITRLYFTWAGQFPQASGLLHLLPHLQVLALQRSELDCLLPPSSLQGAHEENLSLSFHLDTLYLLECPLNPGKFERLIKRHPVQTLIRWRSFLWPPASSDKALDEDQLRARLTQLCPVIENIHRDSPNPINHWDFLHDRI